MDLYRIIDELLKERERVQQSIEALEKARKTDAGKKVSPARRPKRRVESRGRKFMGDEERKQVALRMKSYWERRRQTSGTTAHPETLRMPPSSQHSHAAAAAM